MALRFPLVVLAVLVVAPLAAATPLDGADWLLDEVSISIGTGYGERDDAPPAPEEQPPAEPREAPPAEPEHGSSGLLAPAAPLVHEVAPVVEPVLDAVPVDFDPLWLLDPRVPDAAPAPAPAPVVAPEPIRTASVAPEAVATADVGSALLAAGVAATSAAPAASLAWDRLRRFGLFAVLYARIAKERLLDHGARERLLARVRETPGAPLADLARAADLPRNTAVYHLRRLEKEGLVSSVRQGRVRLYFAPGTREHRENADALAALRHPTTRAIATHIGSAPGLDQRALCEAMGLTPSLAHWHATRLEGAGVVQRQREGRHVRYYPGPAMRLLDA